MRAGWAELEGKRDLHIGARGLIVADERPALERTFPFTSDSVHALQASMGARVPHPATASTQSLSPKRWSASRINAAQS